MIWKRLLGCLLKPRLLYLEDKVKVLVPQSCQLFETLWTVARQAPQFMEFSKQEYWNGLSFPYLGDLSYPGIESRFDQAEELRVKGFWETQGVFSPDDWVPSTYLPKSGRATNQNQSIQMMHMP